MQSLCRWVEVFGFEAGSLRDSYFVIVYDEVSFGGMAGHEAVDDDDDADNRKWNKCHADAGAAKELSQRGPDLRADGRAGVHDERDKNIDVAFEGVGYGSVAGGNDNFEEIGANGDVCRNAQQVDETRHADVARAAAEETAEKSADECDREDCPQGDAFNAGDGKADVRRDADAMNAAGNVRGGGGVAFGGMLAFAAFARRFAVAMQANGFETLPGHETGNADQDHDKSNSDGEVDMGGALKPLDELSAGFNAGDGAQHHDAPKFHIDVAQGAMLARRDYGFANDVSEIGADDEVHGDADGIKSGSGNKTSANAEEPTQDADDEANTNQIGGSDVSARNEKVHYSSMRGRIRANKAAVSSSRRMPWQTMRASATVA